MYWLEQKYIAIIGTRLNKFRKKPDRNYQFSCPICGDSNGRKARGYLVFKKNKYFFYCQKCTASMTFEAFLKHMDLNAFNEYHYEKLIDQKRIKEAEEFVDRTTKIKFETNNDPFKKLKKISQLEHDHPAKTYIESRFLPTNRHHELYWAPEFKTFVNKIIPNKFEDMTYDEGRIIIPFINRNGDIFGLQGRSLNPEDKIRYITIMFDETQPRFYGLERADLTKNIYVFEGPFDAMFIPNGIASAGGDVFRELGQIDLDKSKVIVVYDNEPRHPDTISKMRKAISRGYRVCFWSNTIKEKDINDMVKAKFRGYKYIPTEEIENYGNQIQDLIEKSTSEGLAAELELAKWGVARK